MADFITHWSFAIFFGAVFVLFALLTWIDKRSRRKHHLWYAEQAKKVRRVR